MKKIVIHESLANDVEKLHLQKEPLLEIISFGKFRYPVPITCLSESITILESQLKDLEILKEFSDEALTKYNLVDSILYRIKELVYADQIPKESKRRERKCKWT